VFHGCFLGVFSILAAALIAFYNITPNNMKKLTLLSALLLCLMQLTFAQDNYQRVSINTSNESTIHQLDELGFDLTCGAVFINNQLTIELFDLNGRLIIDETHSSINGKIKVIGLAKLEEAPYFINITSEETRLSVMKKLIKH
jgi:hypothetical protein